MGWALTEELRFDEEGRPLSSGFFDYKIFGALDMPDFQTIIVPTYEPSGPYGAKSVSEIPCDGPGPAITNAIYDAIGVRFREIPITPEKIWQAWREKSEDSQ